MGLDYSYTQPTSSEGYGDNSGDSGGYNTTEHDILLDQAEIEAAKANTHRSLKWSLASPKNATVVASRT
ncbi:hypothetical protein Bca52824_009738 [Brassica carinata]|uniref:Uncharacterized protein n=1 Tax=Brassica carinata TaxID=52824 RepID=A0A8X8B9F1_BRACI|nr:hypothetical protein Bca52824_009738 [Brassica carinata]